MLDFKSISDKELLELIITSGQSERLLLLTVLRGLIEVESRSLFSLTHSSLFSWAIETLKHHFPLQIISFFGQPNWLISLCSLVSPFITWDWPLHWLGIR